MATTMEQRKPSKYDATWDSYMNDVAKYNGEVRRNKRYVRPQDPHHPKFSQAHEDGFFKNPPTDKSYEQGYADPERAHPMVRLLQQATKAEGVSALDPWIRPSAQRPPTPWGMGAGEHGLKVGEAVGPIVQGAIANANEPKQFDPSGAVGGSLRNVFGWGRNPITKGPSVPYRDSGGHNVPLSKLRMQDKEMASPATYGDYMFGRRVDQQLGQDMAAGGELGATARLRYNDLPMQGRSNVDSSILGDGALTRMRNDAMGGQLGGGAPTRTQLSRMTSPRPDWPPNYKP